MRRDDPPAIKSRSFPDFSRRGFDERSRSSSPLLLSGDRSRCLRSLSCGEHDLPLRRRRSSVVRSWCFLRDRPSPLSPWGPLCLLRRRSRSRERSRDWSLSRPSSVCRGPFSRSAPLFRVRPLRMDEISPSCRRLISEALGLSLRRFFSPVSVRSSSRACASAASLARRAALWFVVSLMMRPRKRVFGLALFDGLREVSQWRPKLSAMLNPAARTL